MSNKDNVLTSGKMHWGLVDSDTLTLPPFVYSNGKNQLDVVNEIIEKFDEHNMIFLRGAVGTGKSPIALHLIGHYGKGIISTPTKLLEYQYKNDYGKKGSTRIILSDRTKLSINFLMGRSNFICDLTNKYCSHYNLACTKRIPQGESRYSLASQCPGWSPVYAPRWAPSALRATHQPIDYVSIDGVKTFYLSENPCDYYNQFIHFTKPGAIVMNSSKWEVETWLGRKPKVPLEIIDEGDEYLDGLSYKTSILEQFFSRIIKKYTEMQYEDVDISQIEETQTHFYELIKNFGTIGYDGKLITSESLLSFLTKFLKIFSTIEQSDATTKMTSKIRFILDNKDDAWAKTFLKPRRIVLFLPDFKATLDALVKRSGKLLFMSATTHSMKSFRNIFKIENPVIVDAEKKFPGLLHIMKPDYFMENVTYSKWNSSEEFRNRYWDLLDKTIAHSAKPCLIQVHAYKYLPPKYQPSPEQKSKERWYFGDKDVFFSTKTDRGIDLKDDLCRSIVLLKYPMPDISDVVKRNMRMFLGDSAFWEYIHDIANRNMIQQCGRALRHQNDWCEIYSLDALVLRKLPKFWRGNYIIKKWSDEDKKEVD